jgi:integrase
MGMLYRRKITRDKDGNKLQTPIVLPTWWIKFYINGRPVRESTGTDKELLARRILKEREGRAVAGQPIIKRADRIFYDEVADDLRRHYETTGERGLREADTRFKPLKKFFSGRRIVGIDGAVVEKYVQGRQATGVKNSTINREIGLLGKMLRFACSNNKLLRLPTLRKLKEPAPRSGFFERADYEAVRRHLPADLQVAVTIQHTYGWRGQSEVLTLELRQVDLEAGTLRLDAGHTKNGEGRLVYLTPELTARLREQIERVLNLSRDTGSICRFLFPHLSGRLRGQRIKDFRKQWVRACAKAGVPGMLRHDFRRTATRNMVNAGVSERVAMQVTGHKTRSIFDRYHIVSPADLQEAARKLTGTIPGTIEANPKPAEELSDGKNWCRGAESNCRHAAFQTAALPTELPRHAKAPTIANVSVDCQSSSRFFTINGLKKFDNILVPPL